MRITTVLWRTLGCLFCQAASALLTFAATPEDAGTQSRAAPVSAISPMIDPLMAVRLSGPLLTGDYGEPMDLVTDVVDDVLGIRFVGKTQSRATIDVNLVPAHQNAEFLVTVRGTSVSETVGQEGPAVVHAESRTTFTATKMVTLDPDRGFAGSPTKVEGETTNSVTCIESKWPGLRGALVQRVAWRRVAASQCEAQQIAHRHAERRIIASVNDRADKLIAGLNLRWYVIEPAIRLVREDLRHVFHFSTTESYFQVALRPVDADGLPAVPRLDVPAYATQVWLHPDLVQGGRMRQPEGVFVGKVLTEGIEKTLQLAITGSVDEEAIPTEVQFLESWALVNMSLNPERREVASQPRSVAKVLGTAAATVR